MNRREMLLRAGAAGLALSMTPFPLGWTAQRRRRRGGGAREMPKVLMFTRSQTYEHSVVKRGPNNELSLAERIVTDLAKKNGFEVHCTKDGREFTPAIAQYDAFLFETQGDPTKEGVDHQPPMSLEGKTALLKAVADGKGFVGCH